MQCALPHEVNSQDGEDEQAGVPGVEWVAAEPKAEQRRHLDGERRNGGKGQDDERFEVGRVGRLLGGVGGND